MTENLTSEEIQALKKLQLTLAIKPSDEMRRNLIEKGLATEKLGGLVVTDKGRRALLENQAKN